MKSKEINKLLLKKKLGAEITEGELEKYFCEKCRHYETCNPHGIQEDKEQIKFPDGHIVLTVIYTCFEKKRRKK